MVTESSVKKALKKASQEYGGGLSAEELDLVYNQVFGDFTSGGLKDLVRAAGWEQEKGDVTRLRVGDDSISLFDTPEEEEEFLQRMSELDETIHENAGKVERLEARLNAFKQRFKKSMNEYLEDNCVVSGVRYDDECIEDYFFGRTNPSGLEQVLDEGDIDYLSKGVTRRKKYDALREELRSAGRERGGRLGGVTRRVLPRIADVVVNEYLKKREDDVESVEERLGGVTEEKLTPSKPVREEQPVKEEKTKDKKRLERVSKPSKPLPQDLKRRKEQQKSILPPESGDRSKIMAYDAQQIMQLHNLVTSRDLTLSYDPSSNSRWVQVFNQSEALQESVKNSVANTANGLLQEYSEKLSNGDVEFDPMVYQGLTSLAKGEFSDRTIQSIQQNGYDLSGTSVYGKDSSGNVVESGPFDDYLKQVIKQFKTDSGFDPTSPNYDPDAAVSEVFARTIKLQKAMTGATDFEDEVKDKFKINARKKVSELETMLASL